MRKLARLRLWLKKHKKIHPGDKVRVISKSIGLDKFVPIGREFIVYRIHVVGSHQHDVMREFHKWYKKRVVGPFPEKEDIYELIVGKHVIDGSLQTAYFLKKDLVKVG